ncbi:hypothetical protein [Orenia marismortui]|uniref:DUF2726 domain-containing protein n=1 Tax=Orenia marismortui TaxID=46469 RepID=A0A4R8GDY0_9FIRM|nr:hypothetical protein [Orenia marismortui]TDX43706.1 hypothetical protein C7959_1599 [Orenia marismortui]
MITKDSFNKELKKWCPDNFLVQIREDQEYKGIKVKMKFVCECGHEFKDTRKNVKKFVRRHGLFKCPICRDGKRTWNYRGVKKQFEEHGCELLSNKYNDIFSKLKYRCECGEVAKISFNNFLKGRRCKKCATKRQAKSKRFSYKELKLHFEKYECVLLSNKYKDVHSVLKFKCSCGNIDYKTFHAFNKSPRCTSCGIEARTKTKRHDYDYIRTYFKDHGCELLSKDYQNAKTKLKYICECGNVSETTFDHFYQGCRCPRCSESKGERMISKFLEDKNIYFEKEFTISDCVSQNGYALRFDFALYKNNELIYLIEYDGEQHFEPINHFGGEDSFEQRVRNDKIKNSFCKERGINLIRIPYWDFDNIEKILNKKLNRF